MILKIFNVGALHGDLNVDRVRSSFTTQAAEPAVLWLMPKDHKKLVPGQPMLSRALVSIKKTLLSRTSKLVTNMVKAMADLKDGTTEIKSTENLKAGLDEVNAKYKSQAQAKARNLLQKKSSTPMNNGQDPKGNLHVDSQSTPVHNEEVTDTPGSVSSREGQVLYGPQRYINADTPKTLHNKDIEKLYPSIRAARAGELVRQEVQKTELQFENIDYAMATRFISKAAKSDDQVRAWGLSK